MTPPFDERDTIFARLSLQPGSRAYRTFYRRRPHWRVEDDRLRTNGGLLRLMIRQGLTEAELQAFVAVGKLHLLNRVYECFPALRRLLLPFWRGFFSRLVDRLPERNRVECLSNDSDRLIGEWVQLEQQTVSATRRTQLSAEVLAIHIKEVTRLYGASLVGITSMRQDFYYSHHRNGRPVNSDLPFAIVFAVEMSRSRISQAPSEKAMLTTSMGYLDAAAVGARLSMHLKALGGKTFVNHVMSYNAPLAPLAEAAGIGQIGRSNVLVTREFGSRIRLGAVMTDLALIPDQPRDHGIREFCRKCGACARQCPGKAISGGEAREYSGRFGWPFNEQACFGQWQEFLTDCGICLAVCPFSRGRSA